MAKTGFDNDKYLQMQSQHIKERIVRSGGKLYLEFGGKLFDDYHASRVLPGFRAGQQDPHAQAAEGPGRDCDRHQRRGYRKEQGPRRSGGSPMSRTCCG